VLVDEAHNLVERGRGMYSASLDQQQLAHVRSSAPPALKSPLQRLNREWNALHKEQVAEYQAYARLPTALLKALALCVAALGDYFNEQPQGLDSGLQGLYFELLQFARQQLPAYAVPLFLRIKLKMDTTGTFKYQKSRLKEQAFDLQQIGDDPVYAWLPGSDTYVRLTPQIFAEIQGGRLRY